MLVMFHCFDKDSQQTARLNALQPHLAWVEENMTSIKVAGPLLEDEAEDIVGSLYIIEANDIESAQFILKQDPYYKADIWQRVITIIFKDYAGTWVGGKNWPNTSIS